MSNGEKESDKEIASDVLPAAVEEDAVPIELSQLQPWHRPRKQFVRERQWIEYSRRLIGRLKTGPFFQQGPGGRPELKYLTLPGIDYLDVRALSDCCEELGVELTSTSFLAGSEKNPVRARAHVREESLKETSRITDRSYTFGRKFEEIISESGQAYIDLRRRGPFHIVNIDACGSIALPSANHAQRMVDAIFRLIELQLEMCIGRWLLFVTTDVRVDSFSDSAMKSMADAIVENSQSSNSFKDGATSLLSSPDKSILEAISHASQIPGEPFLKLFSLGFAKWIIKLAETKGWNVKMHTSYFYSTMPPDDPHPSMPCLAFEFVPPPAGLEDRFGVTRARPSSVGSGGSEAEFAMRALTKVGGMVDLDQRMSADQVLREAMIEATRNLLKEAGYAASALADLDMLDSVSAG